MDFFLLSRPDKSLCYCVPVLKSTLSFHFDFPGEFFCDCGFLSQNDDVQVPISY